ncbi:hypothetical protein M8J75_011671 [Diaphorina citri]|nr:hypothetical protein M8J75_011671 [Diaphorina citri]
MLQLLIALSYYATGSFQIIEGDLCAVSRATVCHYIKRVSKEIAKLARQVRQKFVSNELTNCHLLGDNGYKLEKYLLTPFLNPSNIHERNYNKAQIKTRNTVERQYGVWKRRFPCLKFGLRTKMETSLSIIVATAVLHNIAIMTRDKEPPEDTLLIEYLTRRRLTRPLDAGAARPAQLDVEREFGLRTKMETSLSIIVATAVLHNIAIMTRDKEPPEDTLLIEYLTRRRLTRPLDAGAARPAQLFVEREFGLRTKMETSLSIIVATAVLHNIAIMTRDKEPPEDTLLIEYLTRRRLTRPLDAGAARPAQLDVEREFGLRTKMETSLSIIVATAVLHNIAIMTRDKEPPEDTLLIEYLTRRRLTRPLDAGAARPAQLFVEREFGLRTKMETSLSIIVATAVLHNIAIMTRDKEPPEDTLLIEYLTRRRLTRPLDAGAARPAQLDVEREFGLRTKMETSLSIIVATAVLHNIAIMTRDKEPPEDTLLIEYLTRRRLTRPLDAGAARPAQLFVEREVRETLPTLYRQRFASSYF